MPQSSGASRNVQIPSPAHKNITLEHGVIMKGGLDYREERFLFNKNK